MASITGIGGIFTKVNYDPKKLLDWYHDILGLEVSEFGINFLTPNETTLITFEEGQGPTTLNFSVDDLETFMTELKSKGVKVHHDIKEHDYGKFAQILDPMGQIVELAEIKKEQYIGMVNKEVDDYRKNKH